MHQPLPRKVSAKSPFFKYLFSKIHSFITFSSRSLREVNESILAISFRRSPQKWQVKYKRHEHFDEKQRHGNHFYRVKWSSIYTKKIMICEFLDFFVCNCFSLFSYKITKNQKPNTSTTTKKSLCLFLQMRNINLS